MPVPAGHGPVSGTGSSRTSGGRTSTSGSRYSRGPRRTPQCRQAAAAQPGWPGSSSPSTSPARTTAPARTVGRTGSYVVRSPSSWSTDTTLRPATAPANTTVPARAASTGPPAVPTRSTPRWPRPYGCGGARKRAPIAGTGGSGQAYFAPGAGIPGRSGGAGGSGGANRAVRSGRDASARAAGVTGVGTAAGSTAARSTAPSSAAVPTAATSPRRARPAPNRGADRPRPAPRGPDGRRPGQARPTALVMNPAQVRRLVPPMASAWWRTGAAGVVRAGSVDGSGSRWTTMGCTVGRLVPAAYTRSASRQR